MTISEKVAHLKGFLEGMNFKPETPENKVILSIVDILTDISKKIDTVEEDIFMLEDYLDELDADLGSVEEYLFNDDEDDCYDGECDCDCGCDGDEDFYEVKCPHCGKSVFIDDSLDPSDVACPSCNERFSCAE